MIPHLQRREKALASLGWTGRYAEWIALAVLHNGGLFTCALLRLINRVHDGVADLSDLQVDPPEVDVYGTGSPQQEKFNEAGHKLSPER